MRFRNASVFVFCLLLAFPALASADLVGHWTFEPGIELEDLTGNWAPVALKDGAVVDVQKDDQTKEDAKPPEKDGSPPADEGPTTDAKPADASPAQDSAPAQDAAPATG